jgi:F-type H+-transporting ATPase subunit gamma
MATLRDIKARIKTVANIGKITKAMQLVAAAKLNKAQERAHTVRPFADEMDAILGALAGVAAGDDSGGDDTLEMSFVDGAPPLETTRESLFAQTEERRPAVVLITSDRGLCGAFNTNLIRAAEQFLRDNADRECRLVTIGRKGNQYFRRRRVDIAYHREGVNDRLVLEEIKEITGRLVELYVTGEADAVYLIYAKSTGTATYQITTQKFLSIPPVADAGDVEENYILEPDRERLFATLIPQYATTMIFSALADSFASEYAAKMAAMQQATKNAEEKLGDLVIERNRMRQAAITKELAEIVGGAEALK